jgi:DNA-binding XRE family transcriptional regulator/predicted GIY-YIG superfamily endonuclease
MTADIGNDLLRRVAEMHAVYRMYDGGGRVLYIGISGVAGRRFDQHSEKAWFPQVANITLEWFPTKAAAVLAENRAIAAEQPRYNTRGKKKSRTRRTATNKLEVFAALQSESPTLATEDGAVVARIRRELASGLARRRREATGMRGTELATMIGVTRQAVNLWEHGIKVPSVTNSLAYAKALASIASDAA